MSKHGHLIYRGVIWGNISRPINGENVLGGVAYKNILYMPKFRILYVGSVCGDKHGRMRI